MAAHPIWCAIRLNTVYTEITADVLQTRLLRSVRGAQDQAGGLKPSRVELVVRDIAGPIPAYDPDHPLSSLWGIAGRNTRMLLGAYPTVETFESASPVVARADAGSAFWARSTTDAHTGTWSLRAGAITNSQVSDVTFTTPANANACAMWYKVSSASGDGIQISHDGGSNIVNLAGITGWLQVIFSCTPGGTVKVRYTKDAAGAGGSDTAWIDDLTFYTSRNAVELSQWQPDQDEAWDGAGRGMRTTALQAEGVLRRIGRWSDRLRSPVYRQILGRSYFVGQLLGYWPGEDKAGATQLTNAVSGGQPGVATGVTFGGGVSMAGTDTLVKLSSTAKLSVARVLAATGSPNGWQFSWTFQLAQAATATSQPLINWTATNGNRYFFNITNTLYNITVLAPDGSTLVTSSVAWTGFGDPVLQGIVFRVKVSVSAGTVTVAPSWYSQDAVYIAGWTATFAGTTGSFQSWSVSGNPLTSGMTFGHVYVISDSVDDLLDGVSIQAFNGFRNETAGARFLRLCGYWGITGSLIGNASDTQPMGPQKSDTAINLLKEIQQTEDGLMFDSAVSVGLVLRTRRSMYNQAAKLTLTRTQLNAPLQRVTDDLVTGNQITASNRSGGEATVSILSGPGSVLDPPAGAGLYQQTINVNVASDADLALIAGWWAAKLSDTSPRFPQVTVDYDAQPGLETAAGTVEIGDRIALTGVIVAGSSAVFGLIVVGLQETWTTQYRRTITFVCIPDTVYNPGLYDNTGDRYDSLTCTLAVAVNTSATAWTVSTTDPEDVWSTSTPYGWVVDGESLAVTAMSAPSGTGPYTQTCTVVRSLTTPKAHAIGAQVKLNPLTSSARYAR